MLITEISMQAKKVSFVIPVRFLYGNSKADVSVSTAQFKRILAPRRAIPCPWYKVDLTTSIR
jgi:hypothetical protein